MDLQERVVYVECDERRDEGTMEEREIQSNSRKYDFLLSVDRLLSVLGDLSVLCFPWIGRQP